MNKKKKILVAEDEKPMAHALELKLSNSGFDVKTVFSGKEALESVEKKQFDLIFLDLMMPEVDGFTVLTQLKEKGSKVPVVVLSNLGQENDLQRAKDLGAVDYFVKSDTPIAEIVKYANKIIKE
jgi:DNA-binding response OmpR family regulator